MNDVLFYMIRHGQSVANAQGWYAGTIDAPLSVKGRQQAKAARAGVESLCPRPTVIVHSGLSRTRETAEIVNESLGLALYADPRLGEQDFGDWSGKRYEDVGGVFSMDTTPPGGEDMATVQRRVREGIAAALIAYPAPVLFSTHGGAFEALFRLLGLASEDVENCGIRSFPTDVVRGLLTCSA